LAGCNDGARATDIAAFEVRPLTPDASLGGDMKDRVATSHHFPGVGKVCDVARNKGNTLGG
jgi:hypothetical protein